MDGAVSRRGSWPSAPPGGSSGPGGGGARALGRDPAEIRRKNFIPPDRFPFTTVMGQVYDSGNYEGAMDKALALVGYRELRKEQAAARDRGEILGIGLATYVEP